MNKKSLLFLFVLVFVVAISYSQTPPKITVTNPHSGQTLYKGQTYTINWTKTGSMDTQVKITLYKPDHTTLQTIIVRPTANDGSYDWTIPDSIPNGQYIVRVKTMDNRIYDDGDVFTITNAPVQTARITVTNPHSGQTWYKGQTYTITWTKSGSMDTQVKITLYKPDHATLQTIIVRPTANNGSYSWTIPDSIPNGQYIVRVKTMDNAVYDDGDAYRIESNNFTFDRDVNKALSDEGLVSAVRKFAFLPDLTLDKMSVRAANASALNVVNIHAVIKNIGERDAKNVEVMMIVSYRNPTGASDLTQEWTYLKSYPTISVGTSVTFDVQYPMKKKGKLYIFKLVVNPMHTILESTYGNNTDHLAVSNSNLP